LITASSSSARQLHLTDPHSCGPTVRFAPLSFLILRAELTGFYIWPIPLQGAGFIMTQGYEDFKRETVSPKLGEATDMSGVRVALGATLQGSIPLGKWVDILFANGLTGEFWRVANGDDVRYPSKFFYAAKLDAVINGSWGLGTPQQRRPAGVDQAE
jgi:hypothetical protein